MVELDDVAELRSLLRRADPAARSVAYGVIDGWSGADLDEVGARAVLEAAAGSYPSIEGDHRDPGESLARVLWERPRLVAADHVLRAFLLGGLRARRAFVHLLALRRDVEGLDAVELLFDDDGPRELLPRATMPVLDPLLEMGRSERVTALLCRVLVHEGWVWHASDLLARLQRTGRSGPLEHDCVLAAATEVVERLVDACDRAYASREVRPDGARAERESLGSVAKLLDHLGDVDASAALHRMVASADPRVAALGAVRLLRAGARLAPERLGLIARDVVARADLYDGLRLHSSLRVLHEVTDAMSVHESMLARWLSDLTELGRVPDEIEFIATHSGPSAPESDDADAVLYLFRFRAYSPHWSAARGWMVGVSGPWTGSNYVAEDELDLAGHVEEIRTALTSWPRREDGAA